MVLQYREGTARLLVRLPQEYKDRLNILAEKLNRKNGAANYSATSLAREAIIAKIEELEGVVDR